MQGPQSGLPNYGTATHPVTVVVTPGAGNTAGDLNLSGNVTGYGILVVEGTYSAGGNVGWNGIVLIVGQGAIDVSGGGNNSYNGAVFVAKIFDANNNLCREAGTASALALAVSALRCDSLRSPSLRSATAKPPEERTPTEFPLISSFFFLALLIN